LAVCHEYRLSWAVRNCTRDEGGPFEFGNQVLISSHRKAAVVKSDGGERCGNVRTWSWQAWLREASASKLLMAWNERFTYGSVRRSGWNSPGLLGRLCRQQHPPGTAAIWG